MSEAIQFDWSSLEKLLPLCLEFAEQVRKKEAIDLQEAAKKLGEAVGVDDIDKFVKAQINEALSDGLAQAFDKKESAAIAALFAKQCKPVMSLVVQLAQGKMSAADFLAALNKINFSMVEDLQPILEKMLNLSSESSQILADKFGPYLISVYCFAAAYKIYQSAARDAKLARERRLEIERLSNEAIAQLRAERAEMNALVDGYLLDRLMPFSEGIAAMDDAILENDDDGFIRANAELWELFGRNAQYHSAEEFDDLMLSDEAFRL